ncbi:hypothetical protein M422DRAFT_38136 [Sphaerobolus stellatus SS14]|uniref:Uncharacterized protein n=1 Tax=Sphaerobolus stellatus (strain SS14) TaxID=990650 RepID=A0A0C9UMX3_SPHS4|nr:hypothetical protein M422DRAFT_38136 [Sphaerobolus stellatus SS14]
MDHFGVLAEHLKRNDRVRFTTENVVQYRQISKREEGDEVLVEFPTIEPDRIRKGNIVDIRCSFLGVPTTKGRFKFVVHLEGITFLDDGCATELTELELKGSGEVIKTESGLRKRGLTYEAASIGKRNKLDNMDVKGIHTRMIMLFN